jgi:hypothetical protein
MKRPSPINATRTLIHMDNAGPHRPKLTSDYLKDFNFRPVPYSPFSPDPAPSDFYHFGAIKWKLASSEFGNAEALVSEMTDITNFTSHVTLANVFPDWKQLLHKCIDMEGDYVSVSSSA